MNIYTLQEAMLEGRDVSNDTNEFYKAESKKFNEMLEALCLKDIFESLYKENEVYKLTELGVDFVKHLLHQYTTPEGKKARSQNKSLDSCNSDKERDDYISFLQIILSKLTNMIKKDGKDNKESLQIALFYHPLYFIVKQAEIQRCFKNFLKASNYPLLIDSDRMYLFSEMEKEFYNFINRWNTIYSQFDELRSEEIYESAKEECRNMGAEESFAIELLWELTNSEYKNDEDYKRIEKENNALANKVSAKKQILKNRELLSKIENDYLNKKFESFISNKTDEEKKYLKFVYNNWIRTGKIFNSEYQTYEERKSPRKLFESILEDLEKDND